MTSEKWFDWDNPEQGQGSSSSPAQEEQPADGPVMEQAMEQPMAPSIEQSGSDPFQSPSDPLSAVESAAPVEAAELPVLTPSSEPIPQAEAMRPFHLWITGQLKSHEKDRLTDLLARENFGIREVDLELQFEAGRVLLPRISEYAAVLVAQALRGASVEFQLLPSEMASTAEQAPSSRSSISRVQTTGELLDHPAEKIPVTQEAFLPGQETALALDHLIATGLIREPEWKAETSDSYSQIVEALKRELKFKAYLKKADALVRFEAKILTSPWISESECRVQVSALAVRYSP
ncbi:hypothetical protein EBZ37_02520 [bacterium]|nr:hypothetical protein [bacterium]